MKRLLMLVTIGGLVACGAPRAAELPPASSDAPLPRAFTDIAQASGTTSSERDDLFGLEPKPIRSARTQRNRASPAYDSVASMIWSLRTPIPSRVTGPVV